MDKMKILPSPRLYYSCYSGQNLWAGANHFLYEMCKKAPKHEIEEEVFMKLILIGRTYAASVERRKTKENGETTENFYKEKVIPAMINSRLDLNLKKLRSMKEDSKKRVNLVLETHGYLTSIFKEITGDEKRSFCSKYLHFHLPDLFFIYDSRAEKGLKKFVSGFPEYAKEVFQVPNVDEKYAKFFMKCYSINNHFRNRNIFIPMNPRVMDNMLLKVADFQTIEIIDPAYGKCIEIIGEGYEKREP